MKIYYKDPSTDKKKYLQWCDHTGIYEFYYEKETKLDGYMKMDIPMELKRFLFRWSIKMSNFKASKLFENPPKLDFPESGSVEFIYKEYVYSIEASTISLKYEENKDLYNYIFKFAHEKVIKDLEKGLGVVNSRFWGLF